MRANRIYGHSERTFLGLAAWEWAREVGETIFLLASLFIVALVSA